MDFYHYLLDTNIISELVRRPRGSLKQKIEEVGEERVCTNVIVACELRYGALKKGSKRLQSNIELILSAIPILPLDLIVSETYAKIRNHLEKEGTPIGPNDMLIAAHALAYKMVLVTRNLREFSRVPGLLVEDWLGVDPKKE